MSFVYLFRQINGTDVRDVTHAEALDLVRKTKGGKLTLMVQKRAVKVHRTAHQIIHGILSHFFRQVQNYLNIIN